MLWVAPVQCWMDRVATQPTWLGTDTILIKLTVRSVSLSYSSSHSSPCTVEIASLKIYAADSGQGPAPQCTGSMYSSKSGDTCATIETTFGLSAGQVQEANPGLNCADIPDSTDICTFDLTELSSH